VPARIKSRAHFACTWRVQEKHDLNGIFDMLVISDRLDLLLSTMHDRLMGQS
jgi:hypothetical protein